MLAWILIGLISGWLAGKILNGNGYGVMADIGLGLLGGVIGGMIFEVLGVRAHNFIGAILMSTSGARTGNSNQDNPRRNLTAAWFRPESRSR